MGEGRKDISKDRGQQWEEPGVREGKEGIKGGVELTRLGAEVKEPEGKAGAGVRGPEEVGSWPWAWAGGDGWSGICSRSGSSPDIQVSSQ